MGAAALMATAVFIVSFMCEFFAGTRAGVRGALACGVVAALLPGFARAVLRNVMFNAHVTAAADPLEPEAKTVSGGVKAAMRHCLETGRKVHLLVAGVPGCVLEVGLDATSSRCDVEVFSEYGDSSSHMALPMFTPGASPAWFRLRDGEPLRLVLDPPEKSGGVVTCGVFDAPSWAVAAVELVSVVAMVAIVGVEVLAAVLPCAAAGMFADAWMRSRGWCVADRKGVWRQHSLGIAMYAVAIWNLHRFGMV